MRSPRNCKLGGAIYSTPKVPKGLSQSRKPKTNHIITMTGPKSKVEKHAKHIQTFRANSSVFDLKGYKRVDQPQLMIMSIPQAFWVRWHILYTTWMKSNTPTHTCFASLCVCDKLDVTSFCHSHHQEHQSLNIILKLNILNMFVFKGRGSGRVWSPLGFPKLLPSNVADVRDVSSKGCAGRGGPWWAWHVHIYKTSIDLHGFNMFHTSIIPHIVISVLNHHEPLSRTRSQTLPLLVFLEFDHVFQECSCRSTSDFIPSSSLTATWMSAAALKSTALSSLRYLWSYAS